MTIESTRSHRTTALHLIAAVIFLLTALLGNVAGPAFVVLAMAFTVLAANEGRAMHRQD